mgnify:FL=1
MNKKLLTTLLLCIFTLEPMCWAEEIIIGADGQARYVNQETPVIKKQEQLNLEKAKMSNSNKEPLNTTTNQNARALEMDTLLHKIEETQHEEPYFGPKDWNKQFQKVIQKKNTCTFKKSDILSLNSSDSSQFDKITNTDGSYYLIPSANMFREFTTIYDKNDKLTGFIKINKIDISGHYYTFHFFYSIASQDDLIGTLQKVEITDFNPYIGYVYTANGKLTAAFLHNQLYSLRGSEVYYHNFDSDRIDKRIEELLEELHKKNIEKLSKYYADKELQTAETTVAKKSYNLDYGTGILDRIKITEDNNAYLLATKLDKKYKNIITKMPKICMFEKSDNVLLRKGNKDLMLKADLADGDYVLWLPTNETKQIATEYHSDGTVMGYVKTDLNNSLNVYYEYRVKSKNDLNGTLKHIMFCDRSNKTIFIYTAEGKLRCALFNNTIYQCDNLELPTLSRTERFYENKKISKELLEFGIDCLSITDVEDLWILFAYAGPFAFVIFPLAFAGGIVSGILSLITLPIPAPKDKHNLDNQIIDDLNHDEYKSKH